MMNIETKVGLFVLMGLTVSGIGIMKLSDVRFERRYTLYFLFKDAGNLRNKSLIKMSGVEVGRVRKIQLSDGQARVTASINQNVPVYANGQVRVKLTGIIGSQFLDLRPGTPEARRLQDGDTLHGLPTKSLNDLMEKLSDLLEGEDGKPGIGDDLRTTMSNLRNITDSLNAAIGLQRDELTNIVRNLHDFSVDLKGIASDLHEVTSKRKGDIDKSLVKLRSILERVDELIAKVQRGEGSIGKLISDKEMGEDFKETVSNLKQTSESAKEVLARFTKFRSYWEFELRSAPEASSFRGDAGIRIQPRDNKYYYIGVSNAGENKDEFKKERDYEEKNTITALIGRRWGPVILEAGAIRSTAGVGLRYNPFYYVGDKKGSAGWARNIELNAQAFDFGRDEVRGRVGQEREFTDPHYNVGLRYRITRWLDVGASVEDVATISQVNVNTHLFFEDKDLAYLFGFVSFAR